MMSLAALILALTGFATLALSMHKHHRDLFGKPPPRRRALALRSIGWTLLSLSPGACIIAFGWAIGSVFWIGTLTVAALFVVLSLTYGITFVAGSSLPAAGKNPRKAQKPMSRAPVPAWSRPLAKAMAECGRAPHMDKRNHKSHEQAGAD